MRWCERAVLSLYIAFLCISCTRQEFIDECIYPIGKLLFNKVEFEWGEVYTEQKQSDLLKVYNPGDCDVKLRFADSLPCVGIYMDEKDTVNRIRNEFEISAKGGEILCVRFEPKDSSSVGYFAKALHVNIDGRVFVMPLGMFATIVENPEKLKSKAGRFCPKLKVSQDIVVLDTIRHGKGRSVVVPIENVGSAALLIRKIETDCNCVVSGMERRVVLPGGMKNLEITFAADGKIGMQSRTIRLYTNDPQQPLKKIVVRGYVI